jgi:hypothetical protein
MAYGLEALRRIQVSNPEGTPGTAEAATEVIFGKIKIKEDDRVFFTPEQDRNTLFKHVERPFLVSKTAEIELEADFYDRLAVILFSACVRGNVTPTQPNAGSEPNHYLWTLEPASTTPNTPDQTNGIDTHTWEFGDNVQSYEMNYGFVSKIEIEGEVGEDEDARVTVTATIGGRTISTTTFTAALTEPAAAYFPVNLAKLYIDNSYAGLGGTQKTGVLRAFKYTFEPMFVPIWAADGNYYFAMLTEGKKAPELELTYYRDSTFIAAEIAKHQADPKTINFISLRLFSGVEMDSGQSNPPYIYLEGAFIYTEWPELEEEDGISVITVKAVGIKDPTSSKMMTIKIGTTMDAYA